MVIAFLYALLFFQQPVQPPNPEVEFSNGLNFIRYDFRYSPTKLMQAKDGTLWIGTQYGAIAFDGKNAMIYAESVADTAQEGFYGSEVVSISEDSDQNIWVGTNRGSLNVLRKDSSQFESLYRFHRGLPFSARTVREVSDGKIWTHASLSIGWFNMEDQIDDINLVSKVFRPGEYGEFRTLYERKNGSKYLLADGIYEVRYDEAAGITLEKVLEGRDFSEIIPISDDEYLIRDINQLLIWSEKEGKADTLKADEINGSYVRSVLIDDKNHLWVGCRNGVLKYSLGKDKQTEFIGEYNIGEVRDMIQDRTGNIFFSTVNGIKKLNHDYEQYSFHKFPPEYQSDYSYKYLKDEAGNIWIGTNRNLLKYDTEEMNYTSVINDQVYSILAYDQDHILAGTNNGVILIDTEAGQIIKLYNNSLSHHLSKLEEEVFLGIENNRLFIIRNNDLEYLDSIPGVVSMNLIFIDHEKNIWVVSSRTLLKYIIRDDKIVLEKIALDNSIPANVNWLEDDQTGNLWIGTNIGVLIFNKESGKIKQTLTTDNGLMDNQTYEIIRDRSGLMWVKQSREGSSAVDPVSMEVKRTTPAWLTLPGNDNRFCVNYEASDGSLYTDGSGGFFVFHPDSLKDSPYPPLIKLRSFFINGNKLSASAAKEELVLAHFQNDVTIEYAGIQFDDPEKNQFAYKLEGYEDEWNYVDNRGAVTYLSLPRGDYTFKLKAANSSQIWSDEVSLASFTINPPWWKTNAAWVFYLILTGSLVFTLFRLQLNRRLAEAESAKLMEMDSFKSRFFTNITHEFRTPLTVISGLARRIPEKEGKAIQRNSNKLLNLINQILELSSLESAEHKLDLERGEIISYIRYLTQAYASFASENGVSLSVDSDEEEIILPYDKSKIELIIQNLVSNAIKFTPKGGRVSIFVSRDKDTLFLEVIDTGMGIDEADLPKIFDRYYQSATANDFHQGSGIGLSLTRELIQFMNGEITAHRNDPAGTVFRVSLPILNGEYNSQDISESVKPELTNKLNKDQNLVLLIEDNEDVREFVQMVISEKYEIVTASDGDEGFRKALEIIPDIIVSDVMMPGKNGMELTDLLKNDERSSHIPVILLTAKADVESRLEGLTKGADIYLPKPFNEEELLIHIRNLLAQRDRVRARYSGGLHEKVIEDEFIIKIRDLIMGHLDDEKFGISEICNEAGVSRTQLHRKLKALTGMSTSIFIREVRLMEARKLLKQTTQTVAEIAYDVGYGDPNYFSKLYTDKFGYPPSKEREKAKKG
ncbi:ATP-binding protein [Balneola sp. MJW-20]|uniref:hybrid sensor histidine kinase/response regulator n=1 Tax=Gracilimonas aurantiaca TaxID=3234185 RepID=UPI003466A713